MYGQWRVPTVVPPPTPAPQTLAVGFWVGLGGDQNNNSNEVVQAGTQAVVQGNTVSYSAWTQWFPAENAVIVQNFPVAPGDHVEFLVTTPQLNRSFISMRNFASGFATSVEIDLGVTNDGTSAE